MDEGLNPEIAAEHLLMEKASVIKDVLKNGFGSLKGAQKGFIEPISRRTCKVERVETPKETYKKQRFADPSPIREFSKQSKCVG